MTKETRELSNCFKRTAQEALKSCYGFAPQKLSDIKILDGKGRTDFRFQVNGVEYQFKSYVTDYHTNAPDGICVWAGKNTISRLN